MNTLSARAEPQRPDAGLEDLRTVGRAEQRAAHQRGLDRIARQSAFENALHRAGQAPDQEAAAHGTPDMAPPAHARALRQRDDETAAGNGQEAGGAAAPATAAAAAMKAADAPSDSHPLEIEDSAPVAQAQAAPLQRSAEPAIEARGQVPDRPAIDPTRLQGSLADGSRDTWRFELAGAALPVRHVTVQRLSSTQLGVTVQAHDRAQQAQLVPPLQRLGRRLAAHGATLDLATGEADA